MLHTACSFLWPASERVRVCLSVRTRLLARACVCARVRVDGMTSNASGRTCDRHCNDTQPNHPHRLYAPTIRTELVNHRIDQRLRHRRRQPRYVEYAGYSADEHTATEGRVPASSSSCRTNIACVERDERGSAAQRSAAERSAAQRSGGRRVLECTATRAEYH